MKKPLTLVALGAFVLWALASGTGLPKILVGPALAGAPGEPNVTRGDANDLPLMVPTRNPIVGPPALETERPLELSATPPDPSYLLNTHTSTRAITRNATRDAKEAQQQYRKSVECINKKMHQMALTHALHAERADSKNGFYAAHTGNLLLFHLKRPPPYWALTNHIAHFLFAAKPSRYDLAVKYLQYVLATDFGPKTHFATDWLAHAYVMTERCDELKRHALGYLAREDFPEAAAKKLHEKLAIHYFNHEHDFTAALRHAQLRGEDFWIAKTLTPKRIEILGRFQLKRYMQEHMKWMKPGIVRIPMPMNTLYQNFVSLESEPAYLHTFLLALYRAPSPA